MKKVCRHHFYLNQDDLEILNSIIATTKLSKSAVIRHLIRSKKYIQAVREIQNFNKTNEEFLNQLKRIGVNINQVLNFLKKSIGTQDENTNSLIEQLNQVNKKIDDYTNNSQTLMLSIKPKKYKSVKE
ncbi:MAG: hypothetical protein CGEMS_0767 [Candidatus Campylobacter infans]|nr:MAG: hypothetical protein CGEMS_0767 [Candidatus Campylobacter infans]